MVKKELVYAFNKLKKRNRISENDINNVYTLNIQILKFLYEQGTLKDLVIFFVNAYTEIFFEKAMARF